MKFLILENSKITERNEEQKKNHKLIQIVNNDIIYLN